MAKQQPNNIIEIKTCQDCPYSFNDCIDEDPQQPICSYNGCKLDWEYAKIPDDCAIKNMNGQQLILQIKKDNKDD